MRSAPITPAGSSTSRAPPGACKSAGHRLTGWEGVLAGDVPLGAGLSSSAALEMATARAFAAAGELAWDPAAMAKLGQRAENQWVGVNCGIMDQLISAAGRAGPRPVDRLPHPGNAARALSARRGGGRARHGDPPRPGRLGLQRAAGPCEAAAAFFRVPALRDVTIERFRTIGGRDGRRYPVPRPARDHRERPHAAGGRSHAPRRRRRVGPPDEPEPREPARRLRSLERRAQRDGRECRRATRHVTALG